MHQHSSSLRLACLLERAPGRACRPRARTRPTPPTAPRPVGRAQRADAELVLGDVDHAARVHGVDLAGLAFVGRVEPAAEYAEFARVDGARRVAAARELGQEAVAGGELLHQFVALGLDVLDLPLRARVEQRELVAVPAPLGDQALHQQPLPRGLAGARRLRQLLAGLVVQAAAHDLEARGLLARQQVALDAPVDHHVGVELVDVLEPGADRALVVGAEAGGRGVIGRVDLEQQQLQHRFVGRVDGLVELPDARAEELARRQLRDAAEIHQPGAARVALAHQAAAVLVVVLLVLRRDQPPRRQATGEQDGGAVELVEQQVVLRRAAVLAGQRVALAALELLAVHQEQVGFQPDAARPLLQQHGLAREQRQLLGAELFRVADPDVEVAAVGVPQRARAAHQVDRVQARLGRGLALRAEADREAPGQRELRGRRRVAADAAGCVLRDVAGQGGVVRCAAAAAAGRGTGAGAAPACRARARAARR